MSKPELEVSVKSELRSDNMDELGRIVFYDGVVTDVSFELPIGAPYWRATVTTSVQMIRNDEEKWVYFVFYFEDAREFRIVHDYRDFGVNVLDSGVNISFLNGLIYVDFQSILGEQKPTTLEQIRASEFYVAAKRVFWSTEPILESNNSGS